MREGKLAAVLAGAGMAAAWAFSPPYARSTAKALLFKAGLTSASLDGWGRLMATLAGKADHPPCFAQMHEHVQHLSGIPARRFYLTDARAMVEATKRVSDWYGMDIPLPFTDVYNFEAEALGAKLIYGNLDMPTIDFTRPLIGEPGDIARIDTAFDPGRGRIKYVIDATNGFRDVCGLPKILVFCAPFSLAVGLRSYPKLVRDMRRDPAFAHELLAWITEEVLPRYLRLIQRETGARLAFGADAWACFPNLTLEMIEEWVVPYNARLRERMLREGMVLFLAGAADYCEERPEMLDRDTMESCWRTFARAVLGSRARKGMPVMGMGRTQEWPLEWLQEYAVRYPLRLYGKRAIVASINARFVREGPAGAIVDYVKRVVDRLGREGRLFIFFAQIPAATPPAHVHAATAAIRTYGRYPIAADLEEVEFRLPEFEPFRL